MSENPPFGIDDPDGWIDQWLSLHPSDLFAGEFTRFATERLTDPIGVLGSGYELIRFEEQGETQEVHLHYAIEAYPPGRVLYVLSIRSPGD